jgi:TP901-1 family phage major tail protein
MPQKTKGIDFLLYVDTSATATPTWTKVAGQKGATLNRSTETIEVTTKDSIGFKDFEVGFKEWSIEADGLLVDADTGYSKLESAWLAGSKLKVQMKSVTGEAYDGLCIITDLPAEFAYDDMVTFSVTLQGVGAINKTEGSIT